jgi:hypothetical protein
MSGGDNCAMMFMIKRCAAKINQPHIRPFNPPDISLLKESTAN